MKQVERIYITKGDNVFDSDGIKCDKCCAVQIEGKLYWLSQAFASIGELESQLNGLNVGVMKVRTNSGWEWKWGARDEEGSALCSKSFTRIAKHHDDIFSLDTPHMAKTVRNGVGSIWWTATQISATVNGCRLSEVHPEHTDLSLAAVEYCKKAGLPLVGVEEFASLPHLIIKKSSAEQLAGLSEYFKHNRPSGKYFAENLRECVATSAGLTDVLCELDKFRNLDTDFDAECYAKTDSGSYIYL